MATTVQTLGGIKEKRQRDARRAAFRGSEEGVKAAMQSAQAFFLKVLELADQFRDDSIGYTFTSEREHVGRSDEWLRLFAVGCTLRIDLYIPFSNSLDGIVDVHVNRPDAHVVVRMFGGVVDGRGYDKNRTIHNELVYKFDSDGLESECWSNTDSLTESANSEELALRVLSEFIEFAESFRSE